MPSTNPKKEADMATSAVKKKTAMDKLLGTLEGIIKDGAKEMTPEQLRDSEAKFNKALDRAVVARKQRRETA